MNGAAKATLTVIKATPSLSLAVDPSPSQTYGKTVTLTAMLSDADTLSGKEIKLYKTIGEDEMQINNTANYKTDSEGRVICEVGDIGAGTYSFEASFTGDSNNEQAIGKIENYIVNKADSSITIQSKIETYNGSVISIDNASVTGSTGTVTYVYYIDEICSIQTTLENSGSASFGAPPKNVGTYYVKATVAPDDNYNSATSEVATLIIEKNTVVGSGNGNETNLGGKINSESSNGENTVVGSGNSNETNLGGKINSENSNGENTVNSTISGVDNSEVSSNQTDSKNSNTESQGANLTGSIFGDVSAPLVAVALVAVVTLLAAVAFVFIKPKL